ncbi:MAG: hypothetical protein GMKNLPBB_01604 [Myxococcota bacterium]|nr:hypothetical protein [Myxococcota bacterium]
MRASFFHHFPHGLAALLAAAGLCLAMASCSKSKEEAKEARDKAFSGQSAAEPGQAGGGFRPLEADKFLSDPAMRRRILKIPHDGITRRLGAHIYVSMGKSEMNVGGQLYQRITEKVELRMNSNGDFLMKFGPAEEQNLRVWEKVDVVEAIKTGKNFYSRYAANPMILRKGDEDGARRELNLRTQTLSNYMSFFEPAAKFELVGPETIEGRPAKTYKAALDASFKPPPEATDASGTAAILNKPGLGAWQSACIPTLIDGLVKVDDQTGVILDAKLDGKCVFRRAKNPVEFVLHVETMVNKIGAAHDIQPPELEPIPREPAPLSKPLDFFPKAKEYMTDDQRKIAEAEEAEEKRGQPATPAPSSAPRPEGE